VVATLVRDHDEWYKEGSKGRVGGVGEGEVVWD
jgi:hypothetical protein